MSSSFSRLFGAAQGRIKPVNSTPVLGNYVFALGNDIQGQVHRYYTGDQITLSQVATITGIKLVRFRAKIRPPSSLPTHGIDLAATITPSGLTTTVAPSVLVAPVWYFQWGVDSATHGSRKLIPGQTVSISDGVIDVSQLTGNHTLNFKLLLGT